jgi:hypothetical protein
MSLLSTLYLIISVDECIRSADAHRAPSSALVVCDLNGGRAFLVKFLITIKSNSMLFYRACRLSITLLRCDAGFVHLAALKPSRNEQAARAQRWCFR